MSDNDELKRAADQLALDPAIRRTVRAWLDLDLDSDLRAELERLIQEKRAEELAERFGSTIAFGTGGMRGPMGVGTNGINSVMIARATQGLADYLAETHGGVRGLSAVVGFDPRINSERFARQTASTLAANGIRVHLFRALRPTPELSFAVRRLKASAGVMITASHNPKEDNGYKVSWSDGAQIVPPHDEAIVARVESIDPKTIKAMSFEEALRQGRIEWIGEEMDEAFLEAVLQQRINREVVDSAGPRLKIVYTALHGTGGTLVPQALRRWGFPDVALTPSQQEPDGRFPTVKSANPEDGKALSEAIAEARRVGAELVLATDPDGDRVAAAILDVQGQCRIFNGNELAALLTYYILKERKAHGTLPANALVVKSIVTTELMARICGHFAVALEDTLTGFKWICERIRFHEELAKAGKPAKQFVFGCEESIGYLAGTHARDKDGVVGACLIAETAAWAKAQGKTLAEMLDDIYAAFGLFEESQINIYRTGLEGPGEIAALMEALRANPPQAVAGEEVKTVEDALNDTIVDRASGRVLGSTGLPRSNVLVLQMAAGGKIVARPSGTEPKIKFYFSSWDVEGLPIAGRGELARRKAALSQRHERLRREFASFLSSLTNWG